MAPPDGSVTKDDKAEKTPIHSPAPRAPGPPDDGFATPPAATTEAAEASTGLAVVKDDRKIVRLKRSDSMVKRPPRGYIVFKTSAGSDGKDVLVKEDDALPILVRILQSVRPGGDVGGGGGGTASVDGAPGAEALANCEAAAHVIWRLASNKVHKKAMLELGAVPLLVELMRVGTPGGREKAAGALGFLAVGSSGNKHAIMEAGAVPLLVGLLSSSGKGAGAGGGSRGDAAGVAAGALGNLAVASGANQDAIAAEGAVPPLVDLIQQGAARGTLGENAAGALWNIAVMNAANQAIVGDAGAVPHLVRMMQSGVQSARLKAAGALRSLSALDENKQRIVDSGGIPQLVDLLSDPELSPVAKEHACDTLWAICRQTAANRETAAGAGVLGALLGVLTLPRPELHEVAVGMLGMMAADANCNREAIADLGGASAITAVLAHESQVAQANAAGCLGNLAVAMAEAPPAPAAPAGAPAVPPPAPRLAAHAGRQRVLLEAGAVPLLLSVLDGGNQSGSENAAGALWNLVLDCPDARDTVVDAGGIPVLVRHLASPSRVCAENAAGCLWNLVVEGQSCRETVAAAGAVPLLLRMLAMESMGAREEAAGTLWSMSLLPEAQDVMLRHGAVETLGALLVPGARAPGRTRWAAAATLANLSYQNDEVKRQVAMAGAAPHLVAALRTGRHDRDRDLEAVWRHAVDMAEGRVAARAAPGPGAAGMDPSAADAVLGRAGGLVQESAAAAEAALASTASGGGIRNRRGGANEGTPMGLKDEVLGKRAGAKNGRGGAAPGSAQAAEESTPDLMSWLWQGTKYQVAGKNNGVFLFTPLWILLWMVAFGAFLWSVWAPVLFTNYG